MVVETQIVLLEIFGPVFIAFTRVQDIEFQVDVGDQLTAEVSFFTFLLWKRG